jgi:hypothetical protein
MPKNPFELFGYINETLVSRKLSNCLFLLYSVHKMGRGSCPLFWSPFRGIIIRISTQTGIYYLPCEYFFISTCRHFECNFCFYMRIKKQLIIWAHSKPSHGTYSGERYKIDNAICAKLTSTAMWLRSRQRLLKYVSNKIRNVCVEHELN